MSNEVLIKAEGVSKKFCKDLKKSLKYGFQDLGGALFGSGKERNLRPDEFWAVKDISFEVKRGECMGLIGHNGAGKSTLLKMLNGLIKPDRGTIEMRGRVGALIELGAGFNPILTGRENIFNNAAVLGFSKKETEAKLDEIIAFSELEEFIDMPVQNYSSGMKVRLGFAIASQVNPDVLIIDEVLSVGDAKFKIKCYNKIYQLIKNTAIIFVSHSMPQVSKVSTKALLLSKGKIHMYSNFVAEVTTEYLSLNKTRNETRTVGDKRNCLSVESVMINNKKNYGKDLLELSCVSTDLFILNLKIELLKERPKSLIVISLEDLENKIVAQFTFERDLLKSSLLEIKLPIENINTGIYSICTHILEFTNNRRGEVYVGINNHLTINIASPFFNGVAPVIINEK
jgi:lipopolysaccharide transport system ATP-binding protein